MSYRCRITVIKKTLQSELIEKYSKDNVRECSAFSVGQVFTCTTTRLPENFCAWAYDDIAKDLALVAYDPTGNTTKLTCCTSGYHNVYFYLEAITESQ